MRFRAARDSSVLGVGVLLCVGLSASPSGSFVASVALCHSYAEAERAGCQNNPGWKHHSICE